MLIRPASDLHTEFADYYFEKLDTDKDTVCILAGDIGVPVERRGKPSPLNNFLKRASEQFKTVLYIMGNHEYYYGMIPETRHRIAQEVKDAGLTNVHVLENQTYLEDGVMFVCATLWTYVSIPMCHIVGRSLNDFHIIEKQDGEVVRKFRPEDANILHETSRHFIKEATKLAHDDGHKVVVVTHHGPSFQSVHARYKESDVNCAFVSNLDELVYAIHPTLWVHGHVHDPFDYMIGETRIIANPRGYPSEQIRSGADKRHDPALVVEV